MVSPDFQEVLRQFTENTGNFARGQTAITLGDIADQRQQRDTRNNQEFTTKLDASRTDRQQKFLEKQGEELTKRDKEKAKQQLLLEAAKLKIKVNPNDTVEKIISDISDGTKDLDSKRAVRAISLLEDQRKEVEERSCRSS